MMRSLLAAALCLSLSAAAQDKAGSTAAGKKGDSSNTMRDLVKDAVNSADDLDAGTKPRAENAPPDVSMMPFTQDSIRKVVQHHQPQIQACYEETLASKEKVLEGKLMTSWLITPEGLVKNAKVV